MFKYFLFSFFIVLLFSCRSVKVRVVAKEVVNISEGKLYKNLEVNELDYRSLYAKKVDVSIQINGKENKLKGVLKIERDSFIWMSVTAPLGIEVARILLTSDSVKFVDSYNKKYLLTDYDFFYNEFGIRLGFTCIQRILTNAYLNLDDCNQINLKSGKFKFEKTDKDYVLSTVQKKALNRKLKKFFKKKRKNKDFALVLQKLHIEPDYFRPYKLTLEDLEEDMRVSANYSHFKTYENKIFPEKLAFELFFEDNEIKLELKFTRLEFNINVVPNLRIPSKYKNILPEN